VKLQIIQDAISETSGKIGSTTWYGHKRLIKDYLLTSARNEQGYYFAENGKHYWQEVADSITAEAYSTGFLKTSSTSPIDGKELDSVGVALWNLKNDCKVCIVS
jgi:hypothetical protein